jgi:Holliday junction resolvase RusA-like endonuclease
MGDARVISFAIPGKPFGKQRPRATARGGHARVYTPAQTVSFERQVGAIAAPLFPSPMAGPLRLTVIATFAPADSKSRRAREAMIGTPHTQRPDTDNCAKAVMDGLNRIAWADDAQVAEIVARKQWGTDNGTLVVVEAIT